MIDVLVVPAHRFGGCMECGGDDGRGDDIHVFQIGTLTLRLCRGHAKQLGDAFSPGALAMAMHRSRS